MRQFTSHVNILKKASKQMPLMMEDNISTIKKVLGIEEFGFLKAIVRSPRAYLGLRVH
jgi:hypothetical protein